MLLMLLLWRTLMFLISATLCMGGRINIGPYRRMITHVHNEYRRREPAANMNYLMWNDDLAMEASIWSGRCDFKHGSSSFGENIAYHVRRDRGGNRLTHGKHHKYAQSENEEKLSHRIRRFLRKWYDERRYYQWSSYGCGQSCHYTQMIWASTSELGCAITECDAMTMFGKQISNTVYFVCYYSPRGNWLGEYPYIYGRECENCDTNRICRNGLCYDVTPQESSPAPNKKIILPINSDAAYTSSDQHNTAGEKQPWLQSSLTGNDADENCADVHATMCREWAAQGECYRNRYKMENYCRPSCGLCVPDARDQPVGDDPSCVDLYDPQQCTVWATLGECHQNPIAMGHYCTKSCNMCLPASVSAVSVLFRDESSKNWVTTPNRKRPTVKQKCRDRFKKKKCQYLYKLGFCKRDSLKMWMMKNCKKSCKFCFNGSNRLGQSRRCYDQRAKEKCEKYRKRGFCTTHFTAMSKKCAKTCQFCKEVAKSRTYRHVCRDFRKSSKCVRLRDNGFCVKKRTTMHRKCPKTCNFCRGY